MADEVNNEINSDVNETVADGAENTAEKSDKKAEKAEKPKKIKAHRMTKEEKEAAREAQKEKSRRQKEWEDSLVANKRVKREETRRKFKRALMVLLVFSLILTSVVYIMLLFIEENNIRITASSKNDKSIELSFDRDNWSPFLDVKGPEDMWNVSYDPTYEQGDVLTLSAIESKLRAYAENPDQNAISGNHSRSNIIEFCFFLRNSGSERVQYNAEMLLSSNDEGLEDAIRVAWGEGFYGTNAEQPDRAQYDVRCYAAPSDREVLSFSQTDGKGNVYEQGGVEKIAYPAWTSGKWDSATKAPCTEEQLQKYEQGLVLNTVTGNYQEVSLLDKKGEQIYDTANDYLLATGYQNTIPFVGNDCVFDDVSYLNAGETLCVYVAIWIEGSDFDCGDNAIDGYVTLSINFTVE